MSKFFINRPVFTIVISIIITILGVVATKTLPVAQFPEIVPPTVIVSASYPGADSTSIANEVLGPIETQIQGANKMLYMDGYASGIAGVAQIVCTFEIGYDPMMAQMDLMNRVNLATPTMPTSVTQLGIPIQATSTSMLLFIGVYSPKGTVDSIGLSNYVLTNTLPAIQQLPGAGRAQLFGQQNYAMRIWLDPDKMKDHNVTAIDISNAIKDQNLQVAPGRIGQGPTADGQKWTMMLTAKGRLNTAEEFGNIIINANKDGSLLFLKDVARVELGTNSYESYTLMDGKQSVAIGIPVDPSANSLATAQSIYNKMEELKKHFPDDVDYFYPYDTTDFINISIQEVIKTLIEAFVFVALIIYLFLQSWRATLIPVVTIPVSLLGAFLGMQMLGYSINTLTLFGLVLAIGLVVDDAIVVVENMERILDEEKELSVKEVALKAMSQVQGPIISTVLVLCAVFIPASMMSGMTGQLYKQFAVTIAISVVLSGFLALTLAPTLGALLLKRREHEIKNRFFVWFNNKFEKMTYSYVDSVRWLIKRTALAVVLYLSAYGAIWYLNKTLPTSFLPTEDQGYIIANISLPAGSSVDATAKVVKEVDDIVSKQEGVEHSISVVGFDIMTSLSNPSSAVAFIRFTPWDDRTTKETSMYGIIGSLQQKFNQIGGAHVFAMPPSPIPGIGQSDMFQYHLILGGDNNMSRIVPSTMKFVESLYSNPNIKNPMPIMDPNVPVLYVDLDRKQAKTLGVSMQDVFTTLSSTIGYANINQFDKNGYTYWTITQNETSKRMNPQDIIKAWVRSQTTGELVPLSAIVTVREEMAPGRIDHFNGDLATMIMGSPSEGHSTGDVMKALEEVAKAELPRDFTTGFEGIYYQQQVVGSSTAILLVFALIMVYLILAANYENWVTPISIMLSVPYGAMGAYAAVWIIPFLDNNVYFQIGLLVLIGLSAKNAILVCEYAEDARIKEGKSVYDAAMEASHIRYRPMMMTSAAFVLGVLPLAIASGAGAMSRISIGVAMLGGMLAATFIERYFIPVVYYWVTTAYLKFTKQDEGVKNA